MTGETLVLVRTVSEGVYQGSWSDWTDKGIDSAIEAMAARQLDGKARPIEIVQVEVTRRVNVRTNVTIIEDSEEMR